MKAVTQSKRSPNGGYFMIIARDSSCTCFNRMTFPARQAAAPLPPLLVLLPSRPLLIAVPWGQGLFLVSLFFFTLSPF